MSTQPSRSCAQKFTSIVIHLGLPRSQQPTLGGFVSALAAVSVLAWPFLPIVEVLAETPNCGAEPCAVDMQDPLQSPVDQQAPVSPGTTRAQLDPNQKKNQPAAPIIGANAPTPTPPPNALTAPGNKSPQTKSPVLSSPGEKDTKPPGAISAPSNAKPEAGAGVLTAPSANAAPPGAISAPANSESNPPAGAISAPSGSEPAPHNVISAPTGAAAPPPGAISAPSGAPAQPLTGVLSAPSGSAPTGAAPAITAPSANNRSEPADPAVSVKQSLFHDLNMKNIRAKKDYGIKLDLAPIEELCLKKVSSVAECRKAVDEMGDRIDSKVNEAETIRSQQRSLRLQEEQNELLAEQNRLQAEKPDVVVVERNRNRPYHRPGDFTDQPGTIISESGTSIGGTFGGPNGSISVQGGIHNTVIDHGNHGGPVNSAGAPSRPPTVSPPGPFVSPRKPSTLPTPRR